MTKKMDLAVLKKERAVLSGLEKEYYLTNLSYCWKLSRDATVWDAVRKKRAYYKYFKDILVGDLARRLLVRDTEYFHNPSQEKENIMYSKVSKGIDAFVISSQQERESFVKAVLKSNIPLRVATKTPLKVARNNLRSRV